MSLLPPGRDEWTIRRGRRDYYAGRDVDGRPRWVPDLADARRFRRDAAFRLARWLERLGEDGASPERL